MALFWEAFSGKRFVCRALIVLYSIDSMVGRSIASISNLGGIFTKARSAPLNISPRVWYIGYGPPYCTKSFCWGQGPFWLWPVMNIYILHNVCVAMGLQLGASLCLPHDFHHCEAEVNYLSTNGLSCHKRQSCHPSMWASTALSIGICPQQLWAHLKPKSICSSTGKCPNGALTDHALVHVLASTWQSF